MTGAGDRWQGERRYTSAGRGQRPTLKSWVDRLGELRLRPIGLDITALVHETALALHREGDE
jgi:hypothetical protein